MKAQDSRPMGLRRRTALRPQSSYGTPEQLRHLIDHAHLTGLNVFVEGLQPFWP